MFKKNGMVIDIKGFITGRNKKNNARRLEFLKQEGEMVRRTLEEQAAANESADVKDIITAEEIAELLQQNVSPSGFVYRVLLDGAAKAYRSITLANYRNLVEELGHLEKEHEFLRALCLIDKCEEFADYEAMGKAFRIFEYVVRHNKTNTPIITFARQFNIEMRRYLEELNVL